MGQDGRPRGFAHVDFMEVVGAAKAIQLNGTDLGGRPVRVDSSQGKGGARKSDGGGF